MQAPTQADLGALFGFLEVALTSTGRSTHYNSKQEQEELEKAAHARLHAHNRELYWRVGLLPGVLDRAKMWICWNLLNNVFKKSAALALRQPQESLAIEHMVNSLPPQRFFEFGAGCAARKINNGRMRRILRQYLHAHQLKLEWWAVMYREEFAATITHILGKNVADGVRVALGRNLLGGPTRRHWRSTYDTFLKTAEGLFGEIRLALTEAQAVNILAYLLDVELTSTLARDYALDPAVSPIAKVYAARRDFEAGAGLPETVLEGIRSHYHAQISASRSKELGKLTGRQVVQRQAEFAKAGVELELTPEALSRMSLEELYKLMYQGLSWTVRAPSTTTSADILRRKTYFQALDAAIDSEAPKLDFLHPGDAVVIDVSASMNGSDQRKWAPISFAHALAVCARAQDVPVLQASELPAWLWEQDWNIPLQRSTRTDLALAIATALDSVPGTIYVVTDGYENAPAGRTHELLQLVPDRVVVQLSPVVAAESGGVKQLSSLAPLLPASNTAQVAAGLVLLQLERNPALGMQRFIEFTNQRLQLADKGGK